MNAPLPHGLVKVDDIKAHAQRVVKRSADLMLNPYEQHTDHHAVWQQAGEKVLDEQMEGQGA